jgi:hypothetical protein
MANEMAISHAVMGRLQSTAGKYDKEFGDRLNERFQQMEAAYDERAAELEDITRRTSRMRF